MNNISESVPRLNIIGCGRVGRALARSWLQQGLVEIGGIVNRSWQSSQAAAAFLGAGYPVADYGKLPPADLVMISTADEAIASCVAEWAKTHSSAAGVIVFHCSGAFGAEVLQPAQSKGAYVASLHPVKSFADPTAAAETFPGTWCGLEGDSEAVLRLRKILEAAGAKVFLIPSDRKPIYHAGTVFACNYLVALIDLALECLERAGIRPEDALQMLQPIVQETVANVFRLGPVRALTGPIVRGEVSVVAREIEALDAWNPKYGQIYRMLGQTTWRLAQSAGRADLETLQKICSLLEIPSQPSAS